MKNVSDIKFIRIKIHSTNIQPNRRIQNENAAYAALVRQMENTLHYSYY